MSTELIVVVIAVGWPLLGVVLALVMGRRGNEPSSWFILGAILGPLAVVFALDSWRHREDMGEPRVVRRTVRASGSVDVVLGADGSPESLAASRGVVSLLGERLGRLTLVSVLPYDATPQTIGFAESALKQQLAALGDGRVGIEFLRGEPAGALRAFADQRGYGLIAVGTRGHGRSKALLGSIANRLAEGSGVPVLMFSRDDAARPTHSSLAREPVTGD